MVETWVVGMLINLCGNIFINIGTNSVKYDHQKAKLGHHDSAIGSNNSSVLSSTDQLDGTPNAPIPASLAPSFLSRCFAPCTQCWHRFLNHGRWWYIGWSMFTIGNVANFISLSFTPQSLLAGLGSSQFLMNAICEWYFNGHNITARMVKATVLIIIGNTLIVAFASHQSPKLTVDELFQLLFEPAFDIYIVILLILTLILQIYYNETRKALRTYQASMLALLASGGNVHINGVGAGTSSDSALALAAGGVNSLPASVSGGSLPNGHSHSSSLTGGGGGSQRHLTHHASSNGPVNERAPRHLHAHQQNMILPQPLSPIRLKLLPFSYAAVSAIIGTQSVLLAKATSDLIRTSVAGNQQFDQAFTWVILVGWASTIVFWLYRMDTALRKFEGPFIVPVLQVVWTLFSIIGGGIYFQEFNKMDSLAIALFTLGVAVMMVGVYLLAPQPTSAHHHGRGFGVEHALSSQLTHAEDRHLSDVEMGAAGSNTSPYEVRVDPPVGGALSPPVVQIHGLFETSGSSGSGHSKEEISSSLPGTKTHHTLVLNPAPPKITRVTSTGRMIIQSDVREDRDVYLVVQEVSPEFRPFESGAGRTADSSAYDPDSLTDDETQQSSHASKQNRTDSVDSVGHAMAMEKLTKPVPPRTGNTDMGVLGESGLLAGVGTTDSTPPLRPTVQWGTPTRPATHDFSSRPASASGAPDNSSIPPSPSLSFDPALCMPTKRSRGMSLGFSMPMIDDVQQ